MRNPGFLWIIIGIMVILDIYVFQALKVVLPSTSPRLRIFIITLYWAFAIITIATLIAFPYVNFEAWPKQVRTYIFSILVAVFFSKMIASVFLQWMMSGAGRPG